MQRIVDLPSRSMTTRPDGIPERVSGRSTRVSPLAWELLLVVVLVPLAAAIFLGDFWSARGVKANHLALVGHTQLIEGMAFSPDGRMLASCGWDNTVRLWDLGGPKDGREDEPVVLTHESVRFGSAFSPDGSLLVSTGDSAVTIWSCRPEYERLVERTGRSYRGVGFSPDGRTLVLGADDGTIRLWDMPSARERRVWQGAGDAIRSVAFSPDGRLLASSSQDGRVALWDPSRGTEVRTLVAPGADPVRLVAFSPDGRTVGLGGVAWNPRDVLLMDTTTGAIRTRLRGHNQGVNALAFSPDGQTLATAGVDRCIKLWDLRTGKELATRRDQVGWVKTVVFSPDGAWLAYAGNDATVRLWDLQIRQGRPIAPFSSPTPLAGAQS